MFRRLSVLAALCAASIVLQGAAPAPPEVRPIAWSDLAPLHVRLAAAGLTGAAFPSFVERIRKSNEQRVREGDLDHLVFYLLQSTSFTKLPPIEPALSARELLGANPQAPAPSASPAVRARAGDFLRAIEGSSGDARLRYFRELVDAVFARRADREAALLAEYVRVMRFVYEKEFVAQRAERPADTVAELYRTRGLSTDTAVEAGYLVHQGLAVLKSLEPERRIRRVLIVGPGLDLAPRTALLDARPPESYQPWAVIDALLGLRLSTIDDLEMVAADINPRVVTHLRRAQRNPPRLSLMTEIREDANVTLSGEYREYFERLGTAVGRLQGKSDRTSRTVAVDARVARVVHAEALDIVTERLSAAPFDLVVATNILPYFDDVPLMLALTNIAAMLAPDGVFLHNEARPVMHELTKALGMPVEQSRHAVIANVRGAAPLVDSIYLHRKSGSRDAGETGGRGAGELGFSFTNIARQAGLNARTIYGQQGTNTYLIETTGAGVAVLDYDADGWVDIFVVNGSTLDGFPRGKEPTNHLYRNRRDGAFEDVTARAGLAHGGWGQAACVGDYDNDGRDDLFVTYWGQNRLYRNGDGGTFEDVTARAGLTEDRRRWSAGCAFLDYDRDGDLDLVFARYVNLDLANTPLPSSGLCRYKGLPVACGPSGLPGDTNALFRNNGDGTFADVSAASGVARAKGVYGLGVSTLDFDDDGWVDVYVANDSSASALYRNNRDGTFTDIGTEAGCAFNQDGRPQAGMGVAVGDYDRNGTMDIFKTNFAGDTSTLYGNTGKGACEDRTFASGLGVNTRWLGWGVSFLDLDLDGWLDLFLANGHVYPEVDRLKSEAGYRQPKVVYRNLGNGRFADVTPALGAPVTTPKAARGAAFADVDNDGDVDVVVNNVHDAPDLYRLDRVEMGAPAFSGTSQTETASVPIAAARRHWLTLKLVGTRSNRSAIGALARVTTSAGEQRQEVRGGGSYYSQNDLRLHFGLGDASAVTRVVVRWPSGAEEAWTGLEANRAHTLHEGAGMR